jgi:hypothetical protein
MPARKNCFIRIYPVVFVKYFKIWKKIIQYFLQKVLGKKRKKIGKSGKTFPL